MAFDEDDAFAPEPPVPRRSRTDRQRQFLVRRLIAAGVGVLILILILLGIKGCLNARKQRSFENYASDLTSIQQQTKQLSDRFFGRLKDPGNLDPIAFQSDIAADRGTAESLLGLVQGLDAPDELKGDQSELEFAYELRSQAMAGIADRIPTALGKQGATEAQNQIADYMRWFLASDVLAERAVIGINATLKDEGIDRHVPEEDFLPEGDPAQWIDPANLSQYLAGVAGVAGAQNCNNQLHGTELVSTTLNGVALTAGGTTTIAGGAPYDVDAAVLNGGDATERNVTVDFKLSGGGGGHGTLNQIASGATQDATATLKPTPQSGATLDLTVTVRAVPCEELTDNNTATYTVVFG